MSAYVNMQSWKPITAAVYAEILSTKQVYTFAQAAISPQKGKRRSMYAKCRALRSIVAQSLVGTNSSPLGRRLMGEALSTVDWGSLTRRFIRQGKIDQQMYLNLVNLYRTAHEQAEGNS